MKKTWLAIAALALANWTAQAADPVAESNKGDSAAALSGFEIGVRSLHIQLRDDRQGTGTGTREDNFLGSLDRLDENQDYLPTRIYAQYMLCPFGGLGISYDQVEAKTLDNGGSDGNVGAQGPILYLVARYPNDSAFVPFAEIGVAFYHAYFDENSWGDTRSMLNEDTQALVLGLGCDYQVTDQVSFNVYGRLVDGATINAEHWNKGATKANQFGEFPLDYVGFGLGVKYAFK